jgi:arsenate reductase (glutaredoxin)
MSLEIYGIPTCSTVKKALKWLDQHSVEYEFVNTKETRPEREAIAAWVKTLGSKSMRNTSGQSYRAIGEEKKTWSEPRWVEAFSQDPMLLKRPLFVRDGEAVLVGFRGSDEAIAEALQIGSQNP